MSRVLIGSLNQSIFSQYSVIIRQLSTLAESVISSLAESVISSLARLIDKGAHLSEAGPYAPSREYKGTPPPVPVKPLNTCPYSTPLGSPTGHPKVPYATAPATCAPCHGPRHRRPYGPVGRGYCQDGVWLGGWDGWVLPDPAMPRFSRSPSPREARKALLGACSGGGQEGMGGRAMGTAWRSLRPTWALPTASALKNPYSGP